MTELTTPAQPVTELMPVHDGGCQCWPHVSQQDAVRAIERVALLEYRDGLRREAAVLPEPLDVHTLTAILIDAENDDQIGAEYEPSRLAEYILARLTPEPTDP